MQNSRRIKRMSRGRGNRKVPAMNLVSLMDIFTILVFFLLVNTSNTEELPNPKTLKLPDSVAEQKPEETIIVMVTDTEIFVKGRIVASVDEVMNSDRPTVSSVSAALEEESKRVIGTSQKALQATRGVTIMGDKAVPFKLLKKVMASCTVSGYDKIALAVVQKSSQLD